MTLGDDTHASADLNRAGVSVGLMIEGLRFHHIGVVCRDLDSEQKMFELLGYQREGAEFVDPLQRIRGRFLVGGGPRLELLAATDDLSPVRPWLQRGVKFYHQAFETDHLEDALSDLIGRQGRVVVEPVPAVAFNGRKIAFVMLPGSLLIELIQS